MLLGVALLLAVGAGLIWQTLAWRTLLHSEPVTEVSNAETGNEQLALERLEPLFGPSSGGHAGDAPATNLNLVLHGSFVNVDPAKSSAIIQRSGEKPSRFLSGAKLNDNTRLHRIYPDRVELEHNGALESLTFPSRTSGAGSRGTSEMVDPAQFNGAEARDDELLQRQMEALREQMEAATMDAPSEEQPTESD